MLEFLFENNGFITHGIEGIAALVGIFCLKKYKNSAAVFFIWILLYLFIVDTLGGYPKFYDSFKFLTPIKNSIFKSNIWWFTIFFDIVAICLFAILYQKFIKKKIFKKVINYLAISYFLFALILIISDVNALFISSYTILYILQAIVILSCTIFHFIEILSGNKILYISKSLYFYVSITLFLWWLIMTSLVFYDKYYILEDKSFILLKRSIYILANIFMYTTFTVGLIISKPEKIE